MAVHTPRPLLGAPGAAVPPPAYRRRTALPILGLIVAFMIINFADKSVLGLSAVPIMRDLQISKTTYGLIASAFGILSSVTGLLGGLASSRISSRLLLFGMAALWAVAQLPVLLVAAVPALIAGRVLLGAAEGPAAPISMHALYTHFPADKRGLPSSLQISGAALGTLIAAPVLTWLITDFGWRSAFLALAGVSAAWALIWLKAGREGPFADRGDARDAPVSVPLGVPYRRLLRSGTVVGSIASAFGAQWALALSSAWLPAYLVTRLHLTAPWVAATISGVSGLSLVLLLGLAPMVAALRRRGVSSRLSRGLPQGVALAVAGAAMATFPFVSTPGFKLVLVAVAFAGHTIVFPLHYMTAADVVPARQRGALFGIVAAIGTLPALVVPVLAGRIIDTARSEAAGYTTAFLITAAVMLAAAVVAVVLIRPEWDARRLGLAEPRNAVQPAGEPAKAARTP